MISTNLDRRVWPSFAHEPRCHEFYCLYYWTLHRAIEADPQSFAYGIDKVPEVAYNMVRALINRNAEIGRVARLVCHQVGVKPTATAIQAHLLGKQPEPLKYNPKRWFRGKIRVTSNGQTFGRVDGMILRDGELGVHKTQGYNGYSIVHLRTGIAYWSYSNSLTSKDTALQMAERLEDACAPDDLFNFDEAESDEGKEQLQRAMDKTATFRAEFARHTLWHRQVMRHEANKAKSEKRKAEALARRIGRRKNLFK